eukprot:363661-Chlamydomonas_euryale.AAC.6
MCGDWVGCCMDRCFAAGVHLALAGCFHGVHVAVDDGMAVWFPARDGSMDGIVGRQGGMAGEGGMGVRSTGTGVLNRKMNGWQTGRGRGLAMLLPDLATDAEYSI